MKTKVFKQVKKQIAVFASVCIVAGLALTYVACSADEMTAEQRQAEEQFKEDLTQLKLAQQNAISISTRAGNQLTNDEVLSIAEKIDKMTNEFILNHKDVLKNYLPNTALTQDSLDLLCIDEEALETYLLDNFSESFVNQFYAILTDGEFDTGTRAVAYEELNPLESMLLVNTESFREMSALLPIEDGPIYTGNQTSIKEQQAECNRNYNRQYHICTLTSGFLEVSGILLGVGIGVATEGVGAAAGWLINTEFSVAALAVKVACINKAEAERKECLNKIKNK